MCHKQAERLLRRLFDRDPLKKRILPRRERLDQTA
jgi:hypothetical protein